MDLVGTPDERRPSQDRHTATGLPRSPRTRHRMTLGTRLAVSVAVSVALVITLLTLGGMRIAERLLRDDLLETARLTAVALADDIELREEPVTRETMLPLLRDFMSAAVDLYAISVFAVENGAAVPVLTTSEVAPSSTALVAQVLETGDTASNETTAPGMAIVAAPIRQDGTITGAVSVAVSLRTIDQLRRTSRLIALAGAAVAIAGITLLIHLLARRLVLVPLEEIRRTIGLARSGDFTARARVESDHELRDVADGLNTMLVELHDLHVSLNERIAAATGELKDRNQQLVRSYESVLQLREAAARAQQMAAVGQTLANVAHQIGTPLNLVSGHVQLLQHELADPPLQRRLTIVQDQIARVTSAVRELLERARPRDERRLVRLAPLLDRLVEGTRLRSAAAGVALSAYCEPDLPCIAADDTQLELALLNLITNGLDAMPGGGVMTLTATAMPTGVRIVVSDTGTGIDPAVRSKLFEPWITTKARGEGSGLGLSITRDVITDLGGTIAVDSEPGRGTSFTIELPAATNIES